MEKLLNYLAENRIENYVIKEGLASPELIGATARESLVFVPRKKTSKKRITDDFLYYFSKADLQVVAAAEKDNNVVFMFRDGERVFSVSIEGDVLTARERMIPYGKGSLPVCNVETLLADRVEKLYSGNRSFLDLLDVVLLSKTIIDCEILNAAFVNTFVKRGTRLDKSSLYEYADNIPEIFGDDFSEKALERGYVCDVNEARDSFKQIVSKYLPLDLPMPKCKMKLTLVRHGKDDPAYVGGWSPTSLTKEGRKQAEKARDNISGEYDVFLASDLVRAKETAEIINEKLKMEISYCEEFRETNNGIFAGMKAEEFQSHPLKTYFADMKYFEAYPLGESPKTFFERIYKAFVGLMRSYSGKNVLLVTHGGVMTIFECLVNKYPYNAKVKIAPDNCEFRTYELEIE